MFQKKIVTEKTTLLNKQLMRNNIYETNLMRSKQRRLRQFQCCICTLFLGTIITPIILSIACSIDTISTDSTKELNVSGEHENITNDFINVLSIVSTKIAPQNFTLNWPKAKHLLRKGNETFHNLFSSENDNYQIDKSSPMYKHQILMATTLKGSFLSKYGYIEEYATKHLINNRSEINFSECYQVMNDSIYSEACGQIFLNCSVYEKYRSYDGRCNNLRRPMTFGVAYQAYIRYLPPDYSDGISAPRMSKRKQALPSAKHISSTIHRAEDIDDPTFTVMLAVFGQFIDHDLTSTALAKSTSSSIISCCNSLTPKIHPECFPVIDDGCTDFVRSAPAPTCCLRTREQMNHVSAFVDASMIYGTDSSLIKNLRSFEKGQLKMFHTVDGRSLLPVSLDPDDGCNRADEASKGRYCFAAGDGRANENLLLTSMHLLWARQHNFVAYHMSRVNPYWDDEHIFQESRRVIIAQLQHIIFNEFLPMLFGDKLMFTRKLLTKQNESYFTGYDANVDSSIANVFATAAFRFAHNLIPGLIKMVDSNQSIQFVALHKMLFDPFKLYDKEELDRILRGATTSNLQANDPYFTAELKNHMFEDPRSENISRKACGLDLVSLNIQRGRDHGLPGYTKWRQLCGFEQPRSFEQLHKIFDNKTVELLKEVYRDVEDIDLYTGALSEHSIRGSILGPTIKCLLLDQFIRLKVGDRFWYENGPQHNPHAFTGPQLSEIKKTTLAKIICDNADDVTAIQALVMRTMSYDNPLKLCIDIPEVNFMLWKEHNYKHLHQVSIQNGLSRVTFFG